MANTARRMAGMVMAGAILMTSSAAAAADATPGAPTSGHIRSRSPAILALIQQATERSATFRGLVRTIDASEAIVYVTEGQCGHGVRACFHTVTTTAGYRMLWVRVDTYKDVDWNLMGTIGHELRHTIEVLNEPSVKDNNDMFFFYQRIGYQGTAHSLETYAAINAGNAVREEVRAFSRRATLD